MAELVLAVHREQFINHNVGVHGIYPINLNEIDQKAYSFLPRHIAKNKSAQSILVGSIFPQICGYFQVVNEKGEILVYQRKGKEEGLHGLWSIGIGGHIDINDYVALENHYKDAELVPLNDLIMLSSIREIEEELGIKLINISDNGEIEHLYDFTKDILSKFNKVIALSTDPTNMVHLGLPASIQINTNIFEINPAENELINWSWKSKEEIKNSNLNFEPWSDLLIKEF